jgi:hypothetical protein
VLQRPDLSHPTWREWRILLNAKARIAPRNLIDHPRRPIGRVRINDDDFAERSALGVKSRETRRNAARLVARCHHDGDRSLPYCRRTCPRSRGRSVVRRRTRRDRWATMSSGKEANADQDEGGELQRGK